MELAQAAAQPARPRSRRFGLAQILLITHVTLLGLLVVGSISSGIAFLAFRANEVAPIDWDLTGDGKTGLRVRYGPVCLELPGIGPGTCADYLPDQRELSLSYYTPETRRVLVAALVTVR